MLYLLNPSHNLQNPSLSAKKHWLLLTCDFVRTNSSISYCAYVYDSLYESAESLHLPGRFQGRQTKVRNDVRPRSWHKLGHKLTVILTVRLSQHHTFGPLLSEAFNWPLQIKLSYIHVQVPVWEVMWHIGYVTWLSQKW